MNNELLINSLKSNNSELKSYNEGMQIIEEMAEVLKNYTERNYIMASHVILECYAEELYSKNYRKQEWISVDERLPNDKQEVLTIDSQGKMEVCFYEEQWEGIFQQYGGLTKIFNITHWMPLPEAPKMKGGAE